MDHDAEVWDGALLEATFNRFHAHVAWLLAMVGVHDAVTQKVLIVVGLGVMLWAVARRFSKIGYRVNFPVGVFVQTLTVGPVLTFLLVAIPAWVAFRHHEIAQALRSLVTN